jgi:hypothetical protein
MEAQASQTMLSARDAIRLTKFLLGDAIRLAKELLDGFRLKIVPKTEDKE